MALRALEITKQEIGQFRRELNAKSQGYRDTHLNACLDAMEKRMISRIERARAEMVDSDVPKCFLSDCTDDATQEGWYGRQVVMGVVGFCDTHKHLHIGTTNIKEIPHGT